MSGISAIPALCKDLPVIADDCEAIGAMYVLEGSTLGGKIISGMLRHQLQLENEDALKFFSGYGDKSGGMWDSYTKVLDTYTSDPEKQQQIVQAAVATFTKFREWIAVNEPGF